MIATAQQSLRIGNPIWGYIIPGIVFLISFVLTWMLYKHFSQKPHF